MCSRSTCVNVVTAQTVLTAEMTTSTSWCAGAMEIPVTMPGGGVGGGLTCARGHRSRSKWMVLTSLLMPGSASRPRS